MDKCQSCHQTRATQQCNRCKVLKLCERCGQGATWKRHQLVCGNGQKRERPDNEVDEAWDEVVMDTDYDEKSPETQELIKKKFYESRLPLPIRTKLFSEIVYSAEWYDTRWLSFSIGNDAISVKIPHIDKDPSMIIEAVYPTRRFHDQNSESGASLLLYTNKKRYVKNAPGGASYTVKKKTKVSWGVRVQEKILTKFHLEGSRVHLRDWAYALELPEKMPLEDLVFKMMQYPDHSTFTTDESVYRDTGNEDQYDSFSDD